MIMKISIRIKITLFVLFVGLLVFFLSKKETFVPENLIVNYSYFEERKPEELVSCQLDCTMNDGLFHEECIGFNGCTDSLYLIKKDYCEVDSDCVVNLGCCLNACDDCFSEKFCSVSNKFFVEAHSFSCRNSILCSEEFFCKSFSKTVCLNNVCRIID